MTNNILDTVAQVLTAAKNSWSLDEVKSIYNLPLFELIYQSISVHKTHNEPGHVQKCTLLSIVSVCKIHFLKTLASLRDQF